MFRLEKLTMIKKLNIREATETDFVYYSRLSNDTIKLIEKTKLGINKLVNFLSDNSNILTFTDNKLYDVGYNVEEDEDNCYRQFLEDSWRNFKEFLDELGLQTVQFARSGSKFYIRDDSYLDEFLNELENEDITFENALNAITISCLGYSELNDSNLDASTIDEIMSVDCVRLFDGSVEETVNYWQEEITYFCEDILSSIKDISNDIKPIISAYDYVKNFKDNQLKYWDEYKQWYKEEYID